MSKDRVCSDGRMASGAYRPNVIHRTGENTFTFEGFPDVKDTAFFQVAEEHITVSKRPSILAIAVELDKDRKGISDELADVFNERKIEDEYSFYRIKSMNFYIETTTHPNLQ